MLLQFISQLIPVLVAGTIAYFTYYLSKILENGGAQALLGFIFSNCCKYLFMRNNFSITVSNPGMNWAPFRCIQHRSASIAPSNKLFLHLEDVLCLHTVPKL